MAGRIRSIKPEILDDEEVSALSDQAWRMWVSMWLLADDYGNCRAGDRYLAALVWQDSTRSPRVAEILRELCGARIEVYQVNGERYAHIRNWEKHQRIDNAGKPRIPGPGDENSIAWEHSRGEPRRTSESRGDSPPDLRPPTSDHRPTTPTNETPGAASPTGVGQLALVAESPKPPKPRKPPKEPSGLHQLLTVYCNAWVAAKQPRDGKPPVIGKADIKAAHEALKTCGLDDASSYVRRFVTDPNEFLTKRGHMLRDLGQCINAYRASQRPRDLSRGYAPAPEGVPEGVTRTEDL